MLPRIFELREIKLFLLAKQKNDLLFAFGGDKFSMYLAYLADIFETLNQLNKKLQGPGSNIIVHIGRNAISFLYNGNIDHLIHVHLTVKFFLSGF